MTQVVESLRSDFEPPQRGRHRVAQVGSRLLWLRKLLVPAAAIVLWLGLTGAHVVGRLFLPAPSDLWTSFQGMRHQLPSAVVQSVSMTLVGFVIGTVVGVGIGLAMAYSKVVRELFGGVLDFIRPVPVFALIPMFVLWFGIGRTPQIVLIALGTSVILGVTTIEAIRNINPVHIRAALTLGSSRARIYRTIVVPSITPHLLGAIRVGAAAAWGLDVAAEFIGAQNGLGYLMIVRTTYLDTAGIIVIVLIYSVCALVLDFVIRTAANRVVRWTERGVRSGVVASIVGSA